MEENKLNNPENVKEFKSNRDFPRAKRNIPSVPEGQKEIPNVAIPGNNDPRSNGFNTTSLLVGVALGAVICLTCYLVFSPSDSKKPKEPEKTVTITKELPQPVAKVKSQEFTPKVPALEPTSINTASSSGVYDIRGNEVLLYNQFKKEKPGQPFSDHVRLVKTNNPEFYRYINGRYAYSIRVPSFMTIARAAANGSDAIFSSTDGQINLNVYSYPAYLSIDEEYREALVKQERSTGQKAHYTAKGGTWFVVTWEEKSIAYYRKTFVTNGLNTTMQFSYPKALRPTHSRYIDVIEEDFRPGRLR